uniref:Uncharacterized protein n=1 Tax=Cucumis sativus TaxID=3659 RepID=A0A0A0LH56_CUCSA
MARNRREFMVPTPFLSRRSLFVVTHKYLRLIKFLISLGRSSSAEQDPRIKVCKLCRLHIEFGRCLIFVLPCKSRYLRYLSVPMEFGISCRSALLKYNNLNPLYFQMHFSVRDALGSTIFLS